jgi:hypothetical protein
LPSQYKGFANYLLSLSFPWMATSRWWRISFLTVLCIGLKELDSVCNKLQYERRTLAEVRVLFDACIVKHPVMKEHLSVGANIVHSAAIENAVVKLASEMPLSNAEAEAVDPFLAPTTAPSRDDTADEDFVTAILRW